MRVLVCGSRGWTEAFLIWTALDGLLARCESTDEALTVMTGMAPGADTVACEWATLREGGPVPVIVEEHPADWKRHGRRAGFVRNAEMVDSKPDAVLAFVAGEVGKMTTGTGHTVALATTAGIACYVTWRSAAGAA